MSIEDPNHYYFQGEKDISPIISETEIMDILTQRGSLSIVENCTFGGYSLYYYTLSEYPETRFPVIYLNGHDDGGENRENTMKSLYEHCNADTSIEKIVLFLWGTKASIFSNVDESVTNPIERINIMRREFNKFKKVSEDALKENESNPLNTTYLFKVVRGTPVGDVNGGYVRVKGKIKYESPFLILFPHQKLMVESENPVVNTFLTVANAGIGAMINVFSQIVSPYILKKDAFINRVMAIFESTANSRMQEKSK